MIADTTRKTFYSEIDQNRTPEGQKYESKFFLPSTMRIFLLVVWLNQINRPFEF